MPIFEYVCTQCGTRFEKLVRSTSREGVIRCPKCGNELVHKAISAFGLGTAGGGGSSASTGCAPSG